MFTAQHSGYAARGTFNEKPKTQAGAARMVAAFLAKAGRQPWRCGRRESARKLLVRFGGPAPQSGEMRKRFNVDCVILNQRVQGSSPCAPTNDINNLARRSTDQSKGVSAMCPHLHCRLGVDSVSEHQTTNLGVGSSNLFGRGNKINSLGRMWPLMMDRFLI